MPAVVVLIFVGFAILAMCFHYTRGKSLLDQWVESNGFELLEAEHRTVSTGPFFFRTGKDNAVYRVTVRDGEGRIRKGFIRCGSYWGGMTFSDEVTAIWDDE